jgi:hypothetical protein
MRAPCFLVDQAYRGVLSSAVCDSLEDDEQVRVVHECAAQSRRKELRDYVFS